MNELKLVVVVVHTEDGPCGLQRNHEDLVSTLLEELKSQNEGGIGNFRDMRLFKCNKPISVEPRDSLLERCRSTLEHDRETSLTEIYADQDLSSVWPTQPELGGVHLFVSSKKYLDNDLLFRAQRREILNSRIKSLAELPSPSNLSKEPEPRPEILNGRPAGSFGLSPSIYDRELAVFTDLLEQTLSSETRPPQQFVQWATEMFNVGAAYSKVEKVREDKMLAILDKVLGRKASSQYRIPRGSHSHGAIIEGVWGNSSIWEVKREKGLQGDPTLQAACSRLHWIRDLKPQLASNYPCLLIGVASTDFEVSTGCFTDCLHIETVYRADMKWRQCGMSNRILELARVFVLLSDTQTRLDAIYDNLHANPSNHSDYLLPSPTTSLLSSPTASSAGGDEAMNIDTPSFCGKIKFCYKLSSTYGYHIDTSNDFKSRIMYNNMSMFLFVGELTEPVCDMSPGKRVLVKFVSQYNPTAHQILAEAQLAPKLYNHERVAGGTTMVVMEFVEDVSDRVTTALGFRGKHGGSLPLTVYEDIKQAITILHERGLVFGDLRAQNVLVRPDGAGWRGLLVDFDWCSEENQPYPPDVNPLSEYTNVGISAFGEMKKEHDLKLLEKLKNLTLLPVYD